MKHKTTMQNMKQLGIFESDDIFLLRKDKQDKKHIRRNEIMNGIGRMNEFYRGYYEDNQYIIWSSFNVWEVFY